MNKDSPRIVSVLVFRLARPRPAPTPDLAHAHVPAHAPTAASATRPASPRSRATRSPLGGCEAARRPRGFRGGDGNAGAASLALLAAAMGGRRVAPRAPARSGADAGAQRHACERCGRCYSSKSCLARHLRFECGKEPAFQCPYCPLRSKWKCNITAHIRYLHPDR